MSPEMTNFDLIPAAVAAGTLRGFSSRRVFRQPVGSGIKPLPNVIVPPPGSAFSAARTEAPTARHSPFAAGRCPGGKCPRRCWPGSPPDLSCWSTGAGGTPAPAPAPGQRGVHTH